jgi:hypothetical protein
LANDIRRNARAAVAHVEQRPRDAAAVADANGNRAGELRLRFGAAMHDTSFRNAEQRRDRRARRVQLGDERSGA